MAGTLYLCATPIGNLEDITLRVLKLMERVDVIAAEDTRNTLKLLNHFEIKTPMTSYHEHNKVTKGPVLVERLLAGESIALVTDAGMPGISDPGGGFGQALLCGRCACDGCARCIGGCGGIGAFRSGYQTLCVRGLFAA